MRVLLDTHAMYWYVEGDPQLSATAESVIRDASNEVLISPASYWEIAIKISINKCAVSKMPFHHRDPFDRLLVGQASVEQIAVVSRDPVLDAYGIPRLW